MEDDEDVITENSDLLRHLQQAGFDSVETKPASLSTPQAQPVRCFSDFYQKKEYVDKSALQIVAIIKSGNLIFEDDLERVDSVFAHFQEDKYANLKHIFGEKSSAVVIACSLSLSLYFGYFALILMSLFYSYKASKLLWHNHRQLRRVGTFMSILSSNFKLLTRAIKFVCENEHLLKLRQDDKPTLELSTFKDVLSQVQYEVANVFFEGTSSLLTISLQHFVDDSEVYVCKQLHRIDDKTPLPQLHSIYLVLQSQFLARLLFSVVPELVAKPNNSKKVDTIMLNMAVRLKELHRNFYRKYHIVFRNGISCNDLQTARPLPFRVKRTETSKDTLIKNIHDLSNSLQYALIKARELEIALDSKCVKDVQIELLDIQRELQSCDQHINDIIILQKKTGSSLEKPILENCNKDADISQIVTDVGYSDLDPVIEDDIFEEVIDGLQQSKIEEHFIADEFDPLAKKKQRELLGELKSRLKEKAEDWAIRESKVLERKGLAPSLPLSFESHHDELLDKISDNYEEQRFLKSGNLKCYSYGSSSSDEDEISNDNSPRPEMSAFAQALIEARGTLNRNIMEDSFCGSGQNSDAEL